MEGFGPEAKRTRLNKEATWLCEYREEHVEQYNAFMKDEQLQELTGSEPLSLEEELEMQHTWQSDPMRICLLVMEEGDRFVGDVNAFLREEDDLRIAEVSIMICHPAARKKGHATRALELLFGLLATARVDKLEARIKTHNVASLELFRKLGFEEESVSEAFGETTLVRKTVHY